MTTFLGQQDNDLQTRTVMAAGATAAIYFAASTRTDRHQIALMGTAGDDCDITVANPLPLESGDYPAAADLAASEWVSPGTAAPLRLVVPRLEVLNFAGRYVRVVPNGALAAETTASYRPLPPTGG